MKQQVLSCIETRRSVRSYEAKQIPDDMRDEILKAAVYAPSGSNNQSWLFTAIQNRKILEDLNEQVRIGFGLLSVAENDYPAKIRAKQNAQKEDYNFYYHAPTLIVASNVPNYANAMADCSAALENMFLAAHALGLGTCWINQLTWHMWCLCSRIYKRCISKACAEKREYNSNYSIKMSATVLSYSGTHFLISFCKNLICA